MTYKKVRETEDISLPGTHQP